MESARWCRHLWGIAGLFLLLSAGAPASTAVAAGPSPAAKARAHEAALVRNAVLRAVGQRTNLDSHPKRLIGLVASPGAGPSRGEWLIDATLEADDNFTPHMILGGIEIASDKAFKAAFARGLHVYRLTLYWRYPLTDAYGGTSNEQVAQVSLTQPTAAKIKWGNFEFGNLPKVADYFQASPALK